MSAGVGSTKGFLALFAASYQNDALHDVRHNLERGFSFHGMAWCLQLGCLQGVVAAVASVLVHSRYEVLILIERVNIIDFPGYSSVLNILLLDNASGSRQILFLWCTVS